MASKQTTEAREARRPIHTPGGMNEPPVGGEAADGADIASTDMSVDPGGSGADPAPSADQLPAESGEAGRSAGSGESRRRDSR